MSQPHAKVTLKLPHAVYEKVRRAAKGMNKPVEQALATIVAGGIPSLEKVPAEYRPELEAMEDLADNVLWKEATCPATLAQEQRMDSLLEKNQRRRLTDAERNELALLRAQADRRMLRRGYAFLLLRYRGHHIPRLADLQP